MRLYHPIPFFAGLLFTAALLLFVLGVIPAEWWEWLLSGALAVKYLQMGLTESDHGLIRSQQDRNTAIALHGSHYALKLHLPLLLLSVFFPAALLARALFDLVLPVWAAVVFVLALALSVAYSIGIDRSIRAQIAARKSQTGHF